MGPPPRAVEHHRSLNRRHMSPSPRPRTLDPQTWSLARKPRSLALCSPCTRYGMLELRQRSLYSWYQPPLATDRPGAGHYCLNDLPGVSPHQCGTAPSRSTSLHRPGTARWAGINFPPPRHQSLARVSRLTQASTALPWSPEGEWSESEPEFSPSPRKLESLLTHETRTASAAVACSRALLEPLGQTDDAGSILQPLLSPSRINHRHHQSRSMVQNLIWGQHSRFQPLSSHPQTGKGHSSLPLQCTRHLHH